jgi:ABC-type branched-subunit amino acid transport system substrate-binding protein
LASLGENILPANSGPYTYACSLGLWQASYALGRWAAGALGKRALLVAGQRECGYDFFSTFQFGLQDGGGQSAGLCLLRPGAPAAELLDEIQRMDPPDFVFAAVSGAEGADLVRQYAARGLNRTLPLVTTPFAVDESLLPALGRAADGIYSALSWLPDLAGESPRAFASAYQRAAGRAPDAFAALGSDAARLALAVYAGQLPANGLSFSGGRGPLTFDPAARALTPPLYLRRVGVSWFRRRNGLQAELPSLPESDPRLQPLREGLRSGWLNPYLTIA